MLRRSTSLLGFCLLLQLSIACGDGGDADGPRQPAGSEDGAVVGSGGTSATGGSVNPSAPDGAQPPAGSEDGAAVGSGGTSGTGGSVNPSAPDDEDEPTAVEAAEAMGRGFNLGQMFENTQHPRTFEAAMAKIDAYYERGFRNVRIPITWTEEVGGDRLVDDPTVGNVDREHPRLAVIERIVDAALSKPELYVVINAHHEHTLKTEARSAVLQRLWQDISDIFGNRSHRLLFEILNEPHKEDTTAMAPADLRNMTGLAYDAIRAVNPERIIVIGGNQWFGAHEVPAVWTSLEEVGGGEDPYVMATFHHYDPWSFSGSDQGSYDDPWTETQLSSPMETMEEWAESVGNGMPVYIGEWGVGWGSRYTTMTCNNIRLWYEKFDYEYAAPMGQPTAVWDDGGWFEIFSHATGSFDNNLIDCLADGECEWDGEERFNAGCE